MSHLVALTATKGSIRTRLALTVACAAILASFPPNLALAQTSAPSTERRSVEFTYGVEWLTWTQPGASASLQFDLRVDGVRSPLKDVRCTPAQAQAECSAPLPPMMTGPHSVELIAIGPDGVESSPSAPLQTFAAAAGATPMAARVDQANDRTDGTGLPGRTCAAQVCFSISPLAKGLGSIDRVLALPDGRALLVRDGRELLLLGRDSADSAYVVEPGDGANATIADVAIDPDFARTRFAFLALVTRDELTMPAHVQVVRLREAGGRFGEAATVVPELPLADGGSPVLTTGAGGRLFLSMPGTAGSGTRQPYDGLVVAFTSEGKGAGNTSGSPIVARGPEHPGAIAMMSPRQIWVGGTDASLSRSAQTLTLVPNGAVAAPVTESTDRMEVGVRSVTFTSPNRGALVTATPRALFVFEVSQSVNAALTRTPLTLGSMEPLAVAATADGSLLVSAIDPTDPGSSTLLHLQPEIAAR